MITDKQFDTFAQHIKKLQFEGNDVYIHGRKVVAVDLSGDVGREFKWSAGTKIWTKSRNELEYVTYSKASFNNHTKLQRLYDAIQTQRNDYSYMQAKLAFKKYNDREDLDE